VDFRLYLDLIVYVTQYTALSQVAGFTASFHSGLTFATIKGAGHMAPQTKPKETLHLISRFLDDL
jgi:serine carboxypeptidase-like clade 1